MTLCVACPERVTSAVLSVTRERLASLRAEDTRARILREAAKCFAARGYAGATTVEIAKNAKVTQPLVHHYFGSKEKLWRAVLEDLYGRLRTARRMFEEAIAAFRDLKENNS